MGERFYICFYHDKRTYRSSHQAYREVHKINRREEAEQFRVFFCKLTGGYHHTSISQAEMDRRQVTRQGGYGKHGHQHFEGQKRRLERNPRRSPKQRKE